jgi:hypothetical protein
MDVPSPAGRRGRRLAWWCARFVAAVAVGCVSLTAVLEGTLAARGDTALEGPLAEGGATGRLRAWFLARGFYGAEIDTDRGRHFSWSEQSFEITIPALERSRPYRLSLRVTGGRPHPPLPTATLAVDGIVQSTVLVTNEPVMIDADLPVSVRDVARVYVSLSNVYVPGIEDQRALGLVVEQVALQPAKGDRFRLTWRVRSIAYATMVLYACMIALCVPRWPLAVSIMAFTGAAHAWLLQLDGAFLGRLPERWLAIAAGVALAGAVAWTLDRLWRPATCNRWTVAAALVIAAIGLKLATFGHTAAPLGDAIFHLHRAQYVEAGRYFFTSITPRPFFEFPYAIGLYVTALPFWDTFPTDLARVLLLRGFAIVADAGVGLALFFLACRYWSSQTAGLFAAALYPFFRVSLQALCAANLSNVFAQGVFGLGLAYVVWRIVEPRWVVSMALGAVLLALGLLSHFSTAILGSGLILAVALAMRLGRTPRERTASVWIVLTFLLASGLSYGLYYSHFHDVYRKTVARVVAREGEGERRSMVRPARAKALDYVVETRNNFGVPLLALAGAGAGLLAMRRARDPLALALGAWLAVTVGFALLGIFTAVEMRANLAAQPLVALLAAYALAAIASKFGRGGAVIAMVLLAVMILDGVLHWRMCLTGEPASLL